MAELKISVSEDKATNIATVNIDGIADATTVVDLEKVLESLISGNHQGIILDLSSTEYISTAGWSAVVKAVEKIRRTGGEISLVNMIPNVFENYQSLELDKIFGSFENIKKAKEAIQKQIKERSVSKE